MRWDVFTTPTMSGTGQSWRSVFLKQFINSISPVAGKPLLTDYQMTLIVCAQHVLILQSGMPIDLKECGHTDIR